MKKTIRIFFYGYCLRLSFKVLLSSLIKWKTLSTLSITLS